MGRVALVSGVTGQDGAYLAKHLLKMGYAVHGGIRHASGQSRFERLEALGILDSITLHDLDLAEYSNIQRVLEKVGPDEIYNLAAQSFVPASFEFPIYTADVNALGTLRILEAIRTANSKCRFYQASTSEMFGASPPPQDEHTAFHPNSPYAVSKLAAHWATVNYRESFGVHASSGILFNHESPLRGREFVTRKITWSLAQIACGRLDVLRLGNLDAVRDWGYAGDYVDGMWRMLQADQPGTYVLATGVAHTVREFVEMAAAVLDWKIDWSGDGLFEVGREAGSGREIVRVDRALFRPAEVDALIGSPKAAAAKLGWKPTTIFSELVEMMVTADIASTRRGA